MSRSKLSDNKGVKTTTQTAARRNSKVPNGVDMTFGDSETTQAKDAKASFEYVEIPVDEIVPRSINNYKQSKIETLAKSIRATNNRLINPITVARVEDFPADSEVIKKYAEQGTDLSKYKYIIVSGERRFRAWNLLRKEEQEYAPDVPENSNKFYMITANVLNSAEMQRENNYYADSNLAARQISPLEMILNTKDIYSEIKTDEQKRAALIEMNGGSTEGISADPATAAKKFVKEKYVKYYLEDVYGVTDWQESTIKTNVWVADKCSEKVINAILEDKFNTKQAKRIAAFSEDEQNEMLELWLTDKDAYEARFEPSGKKKEVVRKREISSELKASRKAAEKQKKKFEEMLKLVSPQNAKAIKDALKSCDKYIGDLNVIINGIK